jgi:hypothetical protein
MSKKKPLSKPPLSAIQNLPQGAAPLSPVRPDVAALVNGAQDAVNAFLAAQAFPTPSMPLIASVAAHPPSFSLDTFFTGQSSGYYANRPVPSGDVFTLYVMATLARLAYVTNAEAVAQVLLAFPALTWKTVSGPGTSFIFDCWTDPLGRKIVAIPGTQTLKTWLAYFPVGMSTGTRLRSGWWAYAGLNLLINVDTDPLWNELVSSAMQGKDVILVGHSAGGAVAQNLSMLLNDAFSPSGWGEYPTPVVALYSFGYPKTFWTPPGAASGEVQKIHVRVINSNDPVPDAPDSGALLAAGLQSAPLQAIGITPPWWYWSHPPRHLASQTVVVDNPSPAELFTNSQGIGKWIFESPYDQVAQLVNAHSLSAYTLNLENLCRNSGMFDVNLFPFIVQANRLMDAAGQ